MSPQRTLMSSAFAKYWTFGLPTTPAPFMRSRSSSDPMNLRALAALAHSQMTVTSFGSSLLRKALKLSSPLTLRKVVAACTARFHLV